MTPLLPCPFCGGHAGIGKYPDEYAVGYGNNALWAGWCESCGACIDGFDLRREAVSAWNRRAV